MVHVPLTAQAVARAPLGFWTGFTYPFRGMKLVFLEHPGLARYWAFPILITLVVFCLGSWVTWTHGGELLESWWPTPTDDAWYSGVARFFHSIAAFLFSFVLWAVSTVVLMFLTSVIAAPFPRPSRSSSPGKSSATRASPLSCATSGEPSRSRPRRCCSTSP